MACGSQVPVEQLRDQRRLAGLHPHRSRPAGPLGVQPVPERRRGPRQQRARPQLGLPPAAHPLGDQRPLVLRDRPADLQQQLVVRVGAHRPVQELHLAAVAGQLVDQQHLMDVVAGQPVRRGHQDHVQLGQRRVIAQPVQPRPAHAGAAIAVITVDVLVLQLPAALRGRRAQPVKLLLDTLRLGLAGGRHPRIHRRSHQAPPRRSASGRAGRPARPTHQQLVGLIPPALAVAARAGLTAHGPGPGHRALLPGQHRMKSRSPQPQRTVPPGQAQLHPPHTAELAICD